MNLNRQRGIAQLVVVAVMAFLVLGLPLTTKLVQQNQENRSSAASVCICSKSAYSSNVSTCTKNGGKWNCNYSTSTKVPTKKPIPTKVPACASGQIICDKDLSQECMNGVWIKAKNCAYGCDVVVGKCKPEPPMPTKIPIRVPTKIPTKTPIKIDGKCGTKSNSCFSGLFFDISDTSMDYVWRCMGKNGGISVSCKVKRP